MSVITPIQARFEIEMGSCGVFLVCYRLSKSAADDLTRLFRKRCPQGQIIFVMERPGDERVPVETDIALLESSGPAMLLDAIRQR